MNALVERTPRQLEIRNKIELIEEMLLAGIDSGQFEQTIYDGESDAGDEQCAHHFAEGVYARTMYIPAGTVVVGKLHKLSRICIISKGRCTFADEFHREQIEAPWIGEFRAGSKTMVFAHTDVVWTAIIATTLTDPQEILREHAAKNHDEFNQYALEKAS